MELQEKKEALSADHKEFFEKRDQLSDQISLMDKECFRLNSQKEKLEETKEAQTSYLWEEYEVTLPTQESSRWRRFRSAVN